MTLLIVLGMALAVLLMAVGALGAARCAWVVWLSGD